jgi:hypothetical protein
LFISFIRYRKKRCQPALFLFNPSAAQNANSGCPRGALIIQPHSSSSPCRFEFLGALPFALALALPVEIIVFAALILVATPALTIPTASLPVVVIPVILGAVVASLVTVVSITVVVFVLC